MNFQIKPRVVQEERKQPMVTVYFIGANLMTGKDKKTPPLISVGGHGSIRMPQIGESIQVPANVMRILGNQTRTWHSVTEEPIEGITTDARYAKLVKDAWDSGKPLAQEAAEQAAADLPDDVLRKMYEARFGKAEVPVYEDEKEKRSDPNVDGEIVYMDELPADKPAVDEAETVEKKKTQPKGKA